jgi:acyl dehydratase
MDAEVAVNRAGVQSRNRPAPESLCHEAFAQGNFRPPLGQSELVAPRRVTGPSLPMLYLDDLKLGDSFVTGAQAVTADEIIAFGRQFDPQSFHVDPVAARETLFGELVASGWHTAAVSMRLMVDSMLGHAGGVIGQGVDELRWARPVRPGDTLRVEMTVAEIDPTPSRTGRGRIKLHCRTLNQDGRVVQEMSARLLVPRRAP